MNLIRLFLLRLLNGVDRAQLVAAREKLARVTAERDFQASRVDAMLYSQKARRA